jgi:hypothetical protein
MPTQANSTKGAKLIEAQTGRPCSRQNLEKLCDRGALLGSACILRPRPLLVDADILVAEYLAKVAPHQAEAQQPRAKREPTPPAKVQPIRRQPAQLPSDAPEELPPYTVSHARAEFEKANLLELDRKAKEGLLLHREDVERAQATALAISKTRLLGVPSTAKQRIPHLSLDEVEILTTLIREALEELAGWEVEP